MTSLVNRLALSKMSEWYEINKNYYIKYSICYFYT